MTSSPSGRHRSRLPPAREDGHSDRQMDSRTDSRTCGRGLGRPARAAAEGTMWRCPVKSRNPPRARVWERGVHGPVLTALFSEAKGGGHPGAPRRADGQVSTAPPRSREPLSPRRPGRTSRTLRSVTRVSPRTNAVGFPSGGPQRGPGRPGGQCLVGAGRLSGKMERSRDGQCGPPHNGVDMLRVSEPRVEGAVNITCCPAREQARVRGGTDARLTACLSPDSQAARAVSGEGVQSRESRGEQEGAGTLGFGFPWRQEDGWQALLSLNRNRLFLSKRQCPALRRCNKNQSWHSAHLGVPGWSVCPPAQVLETEQRQHRAQHRRAHALPGAPTSPGAVPSCSGGRVGHC